MRADASVGLWHARATALLRHKKPRITYGLYSGGTSIGQKREAIQKLTYPGL